MPTQVKRGDTVEYSIPDKIDRTKDNIVAKAPLVAIASAIAVNLKEAKALERVRSGFGSPENRIRRVVDAGDEVQRFSDSIVIDESLKASSMNMLLGMASELINSTVGISESMEGYTVVKYTTPGRFTWNAPRGTKTVLLGLCGGGGSMGASGESTSFNEAIVNGGNNIFIDNLLAGVTGYQVSLFESRFGYYGRPESSTDWYTNRSGMHWGRQNSGLPGDFMTTVLNVKGGSAQSIVVGGPGAPRWYGDANRKSTQGFVYLAYKTDGDDEPYGLDKVYTVPGDYEYTVPAGVRKISVVLIGGGAFTISGTVENKVEIAEFSDGRGGKWYTKVSAGTIEQTRNIEEALSLGDNERRGMALGWGRSRDHRRRDAVEIMNAIKYEGPIARYDNPRNDSIRVRRGFGSKYLPYTAIGYIPQHLPGANGEPSRFGDIVANGGDRDNISYTTDTGWNLNFDAQTGPTGRGMFKDSINQKVGGPGEYKRVVLDVYPGQKFNVYVGRGAKYESDGSFKASDGAVGIMNGDYRETSSGLFRAMAPGDLYTGATLNLMISNLHVLNKAFNDLENKYWENDLCKTSCQVSCQASCQIACQNCQYDTCHNQNCGGWS